MRELLKGFPGLFSEEHIQAMQAELDRGAYSGEPQSERFARAMAIIERQMAELAKDQARKG